MNQSHPICYHCARARGTVKIEHDGRWLCDDCAYVASKPLAMGKVR